MKLSPLQPWYEAHQVKMIPFGGWQMPVQFSGILDEHHAVRHRVGVFDVSHMGEFIVKGKDAGRFLEQMLTNRIQTLAINQARYTAMCLPDGGTIDDLLVYRLSEESWMLVVNAANTEKDFAWLKDHILKRQQVELTDVSQNTGLFAVQGPLAAQVLQRLTAADLTALKPFRFLQNVELAGMPLLISRTGYTGEDGFELYFALDRVDPVKLWETILREGEREQIRPCGLGARDTLRFEACLPLYGQELSETITPLEAGIGFAVKWDKSFIGKESLLRQKESGLRRKLAGVELVDKGIARHGYTVLGLPEESDGQWRVIGEVTSGTQSPTLKKSIALVLVDARYTEAGTPLKIDIRGRKAAAKVVETPFYRKARK